MDAWLHPATPERRRDQLGDDAGDGDLPGPQRRPRFRAGGAPAARAAAPQRRGGPTGSAARHVPEPAGPRAGRRPTGGGNATRSRSNYTCTTAAVTGRALTSVSSSPGSLVRIWSPGRASSATDASRTSEPPADPSSGPAERAASGPSARHRSWPGRGRRGRRRDVGHPGLGGDRRSSASSNAPCSASNSASRASIRRPRTHAASASVTTVENGTAASWATRPCS